MNARADFDSNSSSHDVFSEQTGLLSATLLPDTETLESQRANLSSRTELHCLDILRAVAPEVSSALQQNHKTQEHAHIDSFPEAFFGDKGPLEHGGTALTSTRCAPCSLTTFVHRSKELYQTLTFSEVSGSFGDLGTLIPLLVALSRERSVLLAPALFFGGLSNLIMGYVWDVPMCVQPMTSIAAVALSDGLSRDTVTAAGILTGAIVFLLGITAGIEIVNKIVPLPVVSGLQIGVGLRLAIKAMQSVQKLGWTSLGNSRGDCIWLAVVCSLASFYWLKENIGQQECSTCPDSLGAPRSGALHQSMTNNEKNRNEKGRGICSKICCCFFPSTAKKTTQHPVGVYLFLIGAFFATLELSTTKNTNNEYGFPLRFFGAPLAVWALKHTTAEDWKTGFLQGAVPQIPLTALNSVISVCALAHSLYPEKRCHKNGDDAVISRRSVCVSVGLMNMLMCPFSAMPSCHGAGGLAGQHRLGARGGASIVFLGINKMLLAAFFGASALTLLDAFPTAILGVMLVIAGMELATTGFTLLVPLVQVLDEQSSVLDEDASFIASQRVQKQTLRKKTVISFVTAAVILSIGKTHYGVLTGWVAHMIYGDGVTDFVVRCRTKWHQHRGRLELVKANLDDTSRHSIACTLESHAVREGFLIDSIDDEEGWTAKKSSSPAL